MKNLSQKNFSADNLEVFILTSNRLPYLKDSLQSVLNQTLKDVRITVLDNASQDGTSEYLKSVCKKNSFVRHYRHAQNVGGFNNLKTAINLAEKDYAVFFHDDDIMHPQYLQFVLKAINDNPDICLVSSNYKGWPSPTLLDWQKPSGNYFVCRNGIQFAQYAYGIGRLAYPCAVYKTTIAKQIDMDALRSFGKIGDRPFMQKTAQCGQSAVFADKCFLRYRIHEGQDSSTVSNGPFDEEIEAFDKFYKDILSGSLFGNFVYNANVYKCYKSLLKMAGKSETQRSDFFASKRKQKNSPIGLKLCAQPIFGKIFYGIFNLAKYLTHIKFNIFNKKTAAI